MKKIEQAVILAGGRGQRLSPLTDKIPKTLVEINGIPFCDYLLESLINVGIKDILFLIGYKGDLIKNRYKNFTNILTSFSYSNLNINTGKRLLNAYDLLNDFFLLLYCDNYWPIELEKMIMNFNLKNAPISTTVFSNRNGTGEYGYENNIDYNSKGYVTMYDKSRKLKSMKGIDIGYFIVTKKYLQNLTSENISFENDILVNAIKKSSVSAYVTDCQYFSITDINSVKKFEITVKENKIFPYTSS